MELIWPLFVDSLEWEQRTECMPSCLSVLNTDWQQNFHNKHSWSISFCKLSHNAAVLHDSWGWHKLTTISKSLKGVMNKGGLFWIKFSTEHLILRDNTNPWWIQLLVGCEHTSPAGDSFRLDPNSKWGIIPSNRLFIWRCCIFSKWQNGEIHSMILNSMRWVTEVHLGFNLRRSSCSEYMCSL